ncbi:MAG TPA: pilus assembly protein TadG-related protein [Euzebyales bacterium]|nr:pilus assembly protein TadG-related protein [Euzebyales bacterium]
MRSMRRDDGNVAIIVALMMTTLFGVAALAVDAGMLFTRHDQVQAGADAAALAIAQECANLVVAELPENCNGTLADGLAGQYLLANALGTVGVEGLDLRSAHGGRAGRITVTGESDEPSVFARFLGIERQRTSATATARWGPMTAVDEVFVLTLCRSDLLAPGQEITLISVPDGSEPSTDQCDGAPGTAPFGFIPPDDTEACRTAVTLLPSTWLAVSDSDDPPALESCSLTIDELLNDLIDHEWCHWTWRRGWHCHDWTAPAEQRTRVLAVYDAARSSSGSHPAYSLIGFEFTGARLGDREEHLRDPWDGVCDPSDDTLAINERQCIRGRVTAYTPPEDGPIVDIDDLNVAGIPDTTVLDVRLVD